MSGANRVAGRVVAPGGEPLWFLGTLAKLKLTGEETGGRFALWEGVLPRGAAPPLHSHPQDETFYVLEGEVTAWIVEADQVDADGDPPAWVDTCAIRGGVGLVSFASGGTPHTFRVGSDTARMLFLSTPAGVENYVRALAEPARWPWLQPPSAVPRVPADKMHEVERDLQMVRHGPPPPPLPATK